MTKNNDITPTPESLRPNSTSTQVLAEDSSSNLINDDEAIDLSSQPEIPPTTEPLPWIKYLQISGIIMSSIGALALLIKELSQPGNIKCFFILCGLLVLAGILSRILKEKSIDLFGAKLLATISIILIPVFWAQFAAIIYAYVFNLSADLSSHLTNDIGNIANLWEGYARPTPLPNFLQFSNITLSTLIFSIALACIVIIPVTVSGIATLAPHGITSISAHLIVLGLLTCLPWRAGEIANVITTAATLISYVILRSSDNPESKKLDLGNLCAQITPLILTFILFARYSIYNSIFDIFCPLVLIASFLRCLYNYNRQAYAINISEFLIALSLINLPFNLIEGLPKDLLTIYKIIIPSLYLLLTAKKDQTTLRYIAYNLLGFLSLKEVQFGPPMLISLIISLIGIYLIALGFTLRDLWLKALGFMVLALSCAELLSFIKDLGWEVLIICGIAITFGASIAPRFINKNKGESVTMAKDVPQ